MHNVRVTFLWDVDSIHFLPMWQRTSVNKDDLSYSVQGTMKGKYSGCRYSYRILWNTGWNCIPPPPFLVTPIDLLEVIYVQTGKLSFNLPTLHPPSTHFIQIKTNPPWKSGRQLISWACQDEMAIFAVCQKLIAKDADFEAKINLNMLMITGCLLQEYL